MTLIATMVMTSRWLISQQSNQGTTLYVMIDAATLIAVILCASAGVPWGYSWIPYTNHDGRRILCNIHQGQKAVSILMHPRTYTQIGCIFYEVYEHLFVGLKIRRFKACTQMFATAILLYCDDGARPQKQT